ncbi:MAG: hypothetical protein QXI19_04375 [Candidatus Caldarchaeum sp.]
MADSLITDVETYRCKASIEDALAAGLAETLKSLSAGEGLRARLAPGAAEVIRVKRFTRILNRIHAPARFTARIRENHIYVERIA